MKRISLFPRTVIARLDPAIQYPEYFGSGTALTSTGVTGCPAFERVKQSQTALPCPQGILQGCFADHRQAGRFPMPFMQRPQQFVANSLRTEGREAGSNARQFFASGTEFSNLAGISSHALFAGHDTL
jgi:hypothetical protein